MNLRGDYLYWQLAHFFIVYNHYRIIYIAEDQNEIWLENFRNNTFPLIRLKRFDIDWSNWMARDVEMTAHQAESIRKSTLKRKLPIANIYVSMYPPVDSYEHILEKVDFFEGKIHIQTFLIEEQSGLSQFAKLMGYFPTRDRFFLKETINPYDVAMIREQALLYAKEEEKKEKQLFQYGKPFFTYVLIIIQLIVFFLLEFNGGSTNPFVLIQYGAKFNPLILDGEWWRFFTPIFLHIGFFHLFMNTLALYYLGTEVEKIYGNLRFLFIYFFAGFTGSLFSFILHEGIAAGASGAIFGCFGALLYLGFVMPRTFFRTIGFNVIMVIGLNLLLGFTVPNIDNAGHIGGLIGGFLATGIVHFPKKKKTNKQLYFLILAIALIGFGLYIGYEQ